MEFLPSLTLVGSRQALEMWNGSSTACSYLEWTRKLVLIKCKFKTRGKGKHGAENVLICKKLPLFGLENYAPEHRLCRIRNVLHVFWEFSVGYVRCGKSLFCKWSTFFSDASQLLDQLFLLLSRNLNPKSYITKSKNRWKSLSWLGMIWKRRNRSEIWWHFI